MSAIVIRSVAEFQAQLQELESDEGGFLYRGQADAVWPVSCSAARRLTQDPTNPIEDQLISSLLVGYLEFLIAKARMRGFLPPGFSETSPDLELLAQLQHQGAATGLIDFTRQPSVALWFACSGAHFKDGAVYVLARSITEEINNRRDLEKKIQSFYEMDTLWSWEPSQRGNRVVAQSSAFVFGVPTIAPNKMERFTVQADSKHDILTQLDAVYGINEEVLFSDFPGYAVANASNKPFDVKRTVPYWREQVGLASDKNERAMAHFNNGVACSAIRDFQSAIEQYSEAIALNPGHVGAYTNRGVAKDALGRFEDAIVDFSEAIRIDPKNYKAYNGRASSKADLDRNEEAIADFDTAIRIKPEYAKAYNNRGAAKAGLGRDEEAVADYSRAIQINSGSAETYFNRGVAKARLGRNEEAIADYDAAIRINPGFAEAYLSQGNAKANLGRYKDAIEDFSDAINRNREYTNAYKSRGLARKFLGQFSAAKEDFERAQALAQRQGNTRLLQKLSQELDEMKSRHPRESAPASFKVVPHRSGYVEGIDSEKLKEILCDLDDDRFAEKDA